MIAYDLMFYRKGEPLVYGFEIAKISGAIDGGATSRMMLPGDNAEFSSNPQNASASATRESDTHPPAMLILERITEEDYSLIPAAIL